MLRRYGLQDVNHFSDPERTLYKAFNLQRGNPGQLFGPRVWQRGFDAFFRGGHGLGAMVGDGFQMPGVFLLHEGKVLSEVRHKTVAERPDYLALVRKGLHLNNPQPTGHQC